MPEHTPVQTTCTAFHASSPLLQRLPVHIIQPRARLATDRHIDQIQAQHSGRLFSQSVYGRDMSLTRVNLEHISSASAILPARNMYLAHLELMYRSAMSSDCASSSQYTAALISPACCQHNITVRLLAAYRPITWQFNQFGRHWNT